MTQTQRPTFVDRYKADGSIDLVCSRCFLTVATCRREDELQAAKNTHVCSEKDLEHLKAAGEA
jgi:hypothetical protein